jgi:hypothetical protein
MADNDSKGKKEPPKRSDELADAKRVGPAAREGEGPVDIRWPDDPLDVNLTSDSFNVNLNGTPVTATNVQGFWEYLRQRTEAISFPEYEIYIKDVLCNAPASCTTPLENAIKTFRTSSAPGTTQRVLGVEAYELLRLATEAFLLAKCGSIVNPVMDSATPQSPNRLTASIGSESRFGRPVTEHELETALTTYLSSSRLPYFSQITRSLIAGGSPIFCGDIDAKMLEPCFIELIWSYWHEEAMLVQTINAISLRFQNKRAPGDRDPLANLETHPLRPLANLLWGYIQDEDHRLTVARRAYEYEHQYGFPLVGRAVPKLRPADRRSRFLEAFHALLHQTAVFYDRAANLTVRADPFPVLNALREVHLILAEGAHNQFRELPWTARVEMLIQQWLLSQREVIDFLGGRPAVPYPEAWMPAVDSMRTTMGWGDTGVTYFNELAVAGERIILSIRFANWTKLDSDDDAVGWATHWKPEIQRYIHAYRAATGVDLSATTNLPARNIDATPPSVLLSRRMARQSR